LINLDANHHARQEIDMPTTLIRSMLSVPGLRERFIENAQRVSADVVLLDLEDSVPSARKLEARALVQSALPKFVKGNKRLFVRPNDLATGLLEADLDAVVQPALDGIHLPKAHNPEVVRQVDHYLTLLERVRGLPSGQIRLIVWLESTEAVAYAEAVCRSSPRLIGASFGSEDYATRAGTEIDFARVCVANAARAAGIIPIDCPEPDYRDLEHFQRDSLHARSLGFRGKYCIHPQQVELANAIFAPSASELTWAERVVDAYETGERQGLGAVGLDGVMVDRPIYQRALDVLACRAC
jgi:citrate lyase subunit beta / citryl-CoA lyase